MRPVDLCSLQSLSPVQARKFLELASLPPEGTFIVGVGADVGVCVVGAGGGACVVGAGVGACVVGAGVGASVGADVGAEVGDPAGAIVGR